MAVNQIIELISDEENSGAKWNYWTSSQADFGKIILMVLKSIIDPKKTNFI